MKPINTVSRQKAEFCTVKADGTEVKGEISWMPHVQVGAKKGI
jgi:hypothetical protein